MERFDVVRFQREGLVCILLGLSKVLEFNLSQSPITVSRRIFWIECHTLIVARECV